MAKLVRYIVQQSGANLLDFSLNAGPISLEGTEVKVQGNAVVNQVFVTLGYAFDFTTSSGGIDLIYLSGDFANYSFTSSGSTLTLTAKSTSNKGYPSTILLHSDDKVIFRNGSMLVSTGIQYATALVSNPNAAAPTLSSAENSTNLPTTNFSNVIRATANDSSGVTFAQAYNGVRLVLQGAAGVDIVYVKPGSQVDAIGLSGGVDLIYLTGNRADYTATSSGSTLTLRKGTEEVLLNGGDRVIFADGSALVSAAIAKVNAWASLTLDTNTKTPGLGPQLGTKPGQDSYINATETGVDLEMTYGTLAVGDTVQLKLGSAPLGVVRTVTSAEATAHKMAINIPKSSLGGTDGSKSITAVVTHSGTVVEGDVRTLTVDTKAPNISLTPSLTLMHGNAAATTALVTGDTIVLTIPLGEAATGFAGLPSTATNNTVIKIAGTAKTANWSKSGSNLVLTYTVAPGNNGTISVDTAALKTALGNSITDTAGNPATLGDSAWSSSSSFNPIATPALSVNASAIVPVVSSFAVSDTSGNTALGKGGEAVQVEVSFSETVTLTPNKNYTVHVKVGNGTEGFDATFSTGASAPTAANHYTFSGTLPSTAGLSTTALQLTSLTVPAGADIHNGSNTALTQSTYMLNSSGYTVDTSAPTLTITRDQSVLKKGQTSTITFTFSEATTDFVSSDITVTGGTLGTLNGSGTSRTAIFTPDADNNAGNASITVALGNYSDAAGNPGTPGTTPTLTFDTKAPTLTITSDKSALRAGQTSTITFTFSEATTDFVSSDITVTGGTLGTLNGSGTSRTAIFTPTADNNAGNASITVALGNYSDAAGNPGTPGTTPTLTFDTKAPTLTITSDKSALRAGQTSTITFTFSFKTTHRLCQQRLSRSPAATLLPPYLSTAVPLPCIGYATFRGLRQDQLHRPCKRPSHWRGARRGRQ